jgi:predicted nucleic acid-binding protein
MKHHKSIYLETTIPSYTTAKPSSDIVVTARQLFTNLFWEKERHKYKLLISPFVIDECSKGNKEAAQRRLKFISSIEQLEIPNAVDILAGIYQKILNIPSKAKYDCLHLAYCVLGKIDYILSWDFTHFGSTAQNKIRSFNDTHSLQTPNLVTGMLYNSQLQKETTKTCQDPIVAEVRRIRTKIAEEHNNDFSAYCMSLKSQRFYMEKNGWKFRKAI